MRKLLARVRTTCAEAYANQDVPFERLVEELQPGRNLSHAPLFQAMLILHVQDEAEVFRLADVAVSRVDARPRSSKYDVTLELQDTSEGLGGWFEYSTDIFEASTIVRFKQHFLNLLPILFQLRKRFAEVICDHWKQLMKKRFVSAQP